MTVDEQLDKAGDSLESKAETLALQGGLKAKLAAELADDADFLRKLKPSLIKARAQGRAPKNGKPGKARPAPTGPQLGERTKTKKPGGPNRGRCSAQHSPSASASPRCSTGGVMHTHATDASSNGNSGVGAAAKDVAEHAGAIARLEAELAGLELKKKLGALGVGVGLAVGAALFGLFMLGFLFATVAAARSRPSSPPGWRSGIVTLGLLAIAGTLGLLARARSRREHHPCPSRRSQRPS